MTFPRNGKIGLGLDRAFGSARAKKTAIVKDRFGSIPTSEAIAGNAELSSL
jgi:hypothetical protein